MVFSSYIFLFWFLPFALGGYYLLPTRMRNGWLAAVSYLFYGWWRPEFMILMLVSTLLDYGCGWAIHRARNLVRRRFWLTVAVLGNIGLLGYFKYANFIVDNVNVLRAWAGAPPIFWETVVLPIGISFYTFQTLSYSIDIFRGRAMPTKNFTDYACFVSLFPQLVAGPILRYSDLAEQIRSRTHTAEKFSLGVFLFMTGFCKKVLLANNVGPLVDQMFDAPSRGLVDGWIGALACTFQIYFDFSGYSDMAIGLGLMLGFQFLPNFKTPLHATSMSDLWTRWHISLTSWLRDNVYIPLGGNRKGLAKTCLFLFVTVFISGVWHGAAWTFVIFGVFHGTLLVIERLRGRRSILSWLPRPLQSSGTTLVWTIGLVLFRASDISIAGEYYLSLAGLRGLGTPVREIFRDPLHLVALLACLIVNAFPAISPTHLPAPPRGRIFFSVGPSSSRFSCCSPSDTIPSSTTGSSAMRQPGKPLSPWQQWLVILLFMLLTGGVFLGDAWKALSDPASLDEAIARTPEGRRPLGASSILNGEFTGNFEFAIERVSPVMRWVRPRWNELLFLAGSMPTPKVAVGPNGWLWYVDEFDNPELGRDLDYSVRRIGEIQARLAAGGVPLVIVPVPLRASFESTRREMPRWTRIPAYAAKAYERFVSKARAAGIPCVDLKTGFERVLERQPEASLFRKYDNHWSPTGAMHAALICADYIESLGILGDKAPREAYARSLTATHSVLEHRGSVGSLLGLRIKTPLRERVTDTMQDIRWVSQSPEAFPGLETLPRVRIFGTSFTQHLAQVWPNHLEHALGCRITSPTVPPRGLTVINDLDAALAEEGKPDLVIWEFPESFLGGGVFLTVRRQSRPPQDWRQRVVQEFNPDSNHLRALGAAQFASNSESDAQFSSQGAQSAFVLRIESLNLRHGPGIALAFEIRASYLRNPLICGVEMDTGFGFPPGRVQEVEVARSPGWQTCLVPLEDPSAKGEFLRFIRLTPDRDGSHGPVLLRSLRLVTKD